MVGRDDVCLCQLLSSRCRKAPRPAARWTVVVARSLFGAPAPKRTVAMVRDSCRIHGVAVFSWRAAVEAQGARCLRRAPRRAVHTGERLRNCGEHFALFEVPICFGTGSGLGFGWADDCQCCAYVQLMLTCPYLCSVNSVGCWYVMCSVMLAGFWYVLFHSALLSALSVFVSDLSSVSVSVCVRSAYAVPLLSLRLSAA